MIGMLRPDLHPSPRSMSVQFVVFERGPIWVLLTGQWFTNKRLACVSGGVT